MTDYWFGFVMGAIFVIVFVGILWALCEDYHQWRKRREKKNAAYPLVQNKSVWDYSNMHHFYTAPEKPKSGAKASRKRVKKYKEVNGKKV